MTTSSQPPTGGPTPEQVPGQLSMSWQEDSPAPATPSPDADSASPTPAGAGPDSSPSWTPSDPRTYSSKMSKTWSGPVSMLSCETLPHDGSMRSGVVSRRPRWARLIYDGGCSSSSPTPPASADATKPGDAATPPAGITPCGTSSARVALWPTPTARDSTRGRGREAAEKGRPLSEVLGGPPNPPWIEWLMGFPAGWTDFMPWGTPSSLRSANTPDDSCASSTNASPPPQPERVTPGTPPSEEPDDEDEGTLSWPQAL